MRPTGVDMTGYKDAAAADRPGVAGSEAGAPAAAPGGSLPVGGLPPEPDALRDNDLDGDVIDRAKVERMRQAIKDGTFTVDAGVVADKMLESAVDLLSKRS